MLTHTWGRACNCSRRTSERVRGRHIDGSAPCNMLMQTVIFPASYFPTDVA